MVVDNSIDNGLDANIRELDNPLYKVVLNCLDMLITRFQDTSCAIIIEMLQNIQE